MKREARLTLLERIAELAKQQTAFCVTCDGDGLIWANEERTATRRCPTCSLLREALDDLERTR